MTLVIALDGMGGDDAPSIVVDGARAAYARNPTLRFRVFGDEQRLRPLITDDLAAVSTLVHTSDAVSGDARPSLALRQGRNSSMRLAIDALKAGEAQAVVSAGNTGALMAMAKVVLKTLPGVDRPAIASLLPARQRRVVILDLGANVDCTAEHLFQFAMMGEVYARVILDVKKPSVALLNVGTEEVKGDHVVRGAAALLRDSSLPIDFYGFVEGTDVTEGAVDVVVTDGFTGNVALKFTEGTATLLSTGLREAFEGGGWRAKLGYLLAQPALRAFRHRFDPRRYNGAMFLGLNGVVVKSHGGTDAVGFGAAIDVAAGLVAKRTNERIIEEIEKVEIHESPEPAAAAS